MSLFADVCHWRPFHSTPPNTYLPEHLRLQQLPMQFTSVAHYIASFRPLIVSETVASATQACERKPPRSRKVSVHPVEGPRLAALTPHPSLIEIDVLLERDSDPAGRRAASRFSPSLFSTNTLVLLSRSPSCFTKREAAQALPGVIISTAFGRLEVVVNEAAWRRVLNTTTGERCTIWPLMNLVTHIREYSALAFARHLRIQHSLYTGDASDPTAEANGGTSRKIFMMADGYMAHLNQQYNEFQVQAISSAAKRDGFTLIQGPPGTGKTSTVVGCLNTVHVAAYNRYRDTLIHGRDRDAELRQQLDALQEPGAGAGASAGAGAGAGTGASADAKTDASARTAGPTAATPGEGGAGLEDGEVGVVENRLAAETPSLHAVKNTGVMDWLTSKTVPLSKSLQRARRTLARKPRILVTAPSNAAVDGIILRLLETQFVDGNRQRYVPKILRLGSGASEQVRARGVTLKDRVKILLDLGSADIAHHRQRCFRSRDAIQKQIGALRDGCAARIKTGKDASVVPVFARLFPLIEAYEAVQAELDRLTAVHTLRTYPSTNARNVEKTARDHLSVSMLSEAEIVFTTLSSSALDILQYFLEEEDGQFEIVVIDEAAQAVELATLIPLRYGCRQCVLVGDPKQLPATIMSQDAVRKGYSRSLFARLVECGHPFVRLKTQFRSHPALAAFPSKHFYDGELLNSQEVLDHRNARFHSWPIFRPLLFYDVQGAEGRDSMRSMQNVTEAEFAMNLLRALAAWEAPNPDGPPFRFHGTIGIITPYRGQVALLQRMLPSAFGDDPLGMLRRIEVNTVDGFQGREKDVIILSCVRAGRGSSSIGFLRDPRRMNVALTRAKFALWVLGHGPSLRTSRDWAAFVDHAHQQRAVIPVTNPRVDLLQLDKQLRNQRSENT